MSDSRSEFAGRRILVTGARGFIGSHLCRRLVELNAEVHGVSRQQQRKRNGIRGWRADFSDFEEARAVFNAVQPDIVLHLAGYPAGGREVALVLPTFRSNLMTTVNLLTIAAERGCGRVVLANSMEEPGLKETGVGSSPYAVSKWAANAYGRMFHTLFELPVVILRVFMVYGPGQWNLRKLIPYTIVSLLKGESPKFASGQRFIDWVYVDDVVSAFLAAALAPAIEGTIIDIGTGQPIRTRDLLLLLKDLVSPQSPLNFDSLPERPLEQESVAGLSTTEAAIGWRPVTQLEDGLERTIEWYRQQLALGMI